MAKRLTEEMVIARTKISDLSKIKRLNCWGSELVDVSLLRKMPCVEVLSLSINKINSLVDFQFCKKLEELYIRQNDIRDLNEVMYLQNLQNLKNLWLGENPCANIEGYRLSVIKALPQLQKLDNVQISQDEQREAQRKAKNLYHPEEEQDVSEEEEYVAPTPSQQYNRYQEYPEQEYSPPVQRSPPRQETEYELEESEDLYPREDVSEESREYSPPRQASPPRRTEPVKRNYTPEPEYIDRRRNSYERESPKQTQYYDEYTNGDRYVQQQTHSSGEILVLQGHEKRERYTCPAAAHRPPFNRRPVTRNSNILSAVLCLVKELDYPSLEVVEMAVRCRMDELDE
ncbi:acidic leucine-rich nuclear phosphoprotein 32 family member A isoform X2 [Anoplophora glabripennis]|uniref:acidic leucine-rich nuclear phosphoprotein 32 family member A isoform X2 n=1 Tax=Anoplophora glabripennis TaxID=217634 RepID=UPI000874AAB5|nr:acidic leucine-rich nuclear phosphoprotein 32 family member A isoform X2 [Anoplophora glabripennis]